MTLNLDHLFSTQYLFNSNLPQFLPNTLKILVIIFSLLLIISITIKFTLERKKIIGPFKKFWTKLTNWGLLISILIFLLIFFRQEKVGFLSMPIWLLLLSLAALVWLFFIIRYALVKVPKIKQEIKQRKEKEKYLP